MPDLTEEKMGLLSAIRKALVNSSKENRRTPTYLEIPLSAFESYREILEDFYGGSIRAQVEMDGREGLFFMGIPMFPVKDLDVGRVRTVTLSA